MASRMVRVLTCASACAGLRQQDLHEVVLRLEAAACAAKDDLVLHHLDRALQLLGHPGLASEAEPDCPPEVRAFLAILAMSPFVEVAHV